MARWVCWSLPCVLAALGCAGTETGNPDPTAPRDGGGAYDGGGPPPTLDAGVIPSDAGGPPPPWDSGIVPEHDGGDGDGGAAEPADPDLDAGAR